MYREQITFLWCCSFVLIVCFTFSTFSLTDQSPPLPEMEKDLLCPSKNVTANLPEKNMAENLHSKPRKSTDANKGRGIFILKF